jgi:large conductance mechanosensitive channel
MGFIKEFKDFAATGNFVDLAVGVVMGAAVGKVVSAFIDGMVLPIVGMISGKDFSNLYFGLNDATKTAAATGTVSLADAQKLGPVFAYGNFISALVTFLLIALVVFIALKGINKMKKAKAAEAPAGPSLTDALLMEIRDSLKK